MVPALLPTSGYVPCRRLHFLLLLILALAPGGRVSADDADDLKDIMRVKLKHAQNVLEALAVEDYDGMARNSQQLALLSQASAWQILETAEYLQQSTEFRRAANEITDAAKKRNLDAAAMAYVSMTIKCVNCHKYVRGVRTAQAAPDEGDIVPRRRNRRISEPRR